MGKYHVTLFMFLLMLFVSLNSTLIKNPSTNNYQNTPLELVELLEALKEIPPLTIESNSIGSLTLPEGLQLKSYVYTHDASAVLNDILIKQIKYQECMTAVISMYIGQELLLSEFGEDIQSAFKYMNLANNLAHKNGYSFEDSKLAKVKN